MEHEAPQIREVSQSFSVGEFDIFDLETGTVVGYDAVAAQLAAAKRTAMSDLNRQLFADGTARPPVPPPTWRERIRKRGARVRSYCSTLWMALRGYDPYDVDVEYDW